MLDKIRHFSLENPATVYDEESLTVLQLCGRLGAKVNETVQAFNDLEANTGKELEAQNTKILEMVNGLSETVSEVFEDLVENGVFDSTIDEYSKTEMSNVKRDLNKRVDYANIGRDVMVLDWEPGTYDGPTMGKTSSATRIRMPEPKPVPSTLAYIGIKSGLKVTVHEYTLEDDVYTHVRTNEWMTETRPYYFKGTHFLAVVGSVSDGMMLPAVGDNVVFSSELVSLDGIKKDVARLKGLLAYMGVARSTEISFSETRVDAASTRRWFFPDIIPANSYVRTVKVDCSKTRENITVEIWEREGDVLTLAHTVVGKAQAGVTVDLNVGMIFNNPVMVSIYTPEACVNCYSETGNSLIAFANTTANSLSVANGEVFNGYSLGASAVIYDTYKAIGGSKSVHDLYVGPDREFTEIQDAVDYARRNPSIMPCVIHVAPGKYKRFSMIRYEGEPYPWENAPVNRISIIGTNALDCFVADYENNYDNPPAELLFTGIIENIGFLSYATNQDANATKSAYGAHIDARPANNASYDMTFRNCQFMSVKGPAVGIGMHKNGKITFENCTFRSVLNSGYTNNNANWKSLENYGAVYAHSSVDASATNQQLIFKNCIVEPTSANGYGFKVEKPEGGSGNMTVSYFHNVVLSKDVEKCKHFSISASTYETGNNFDVTLGLEL